MKPWRCVICNGSGKSATVPTGTNAAPLDCHACHGTGVLWGVEDAPHYQPALIYPIYPQWPYGGPWWQVTYGMGSLSGASSGTAFYGLDTGESAGAAVRVS